VAKWGYCSRDGRCVSQSQFRCQLAEYHAGYGFHHLQAGRVRIGLRSLIKAWLANPARIKYIFYIAAALLGWRPRW